MLQTIAQHRTINTGPSAFAFPLVRLSSVPGALGNVHHNIRAVRGILVQWPRQSATNVVASVFRKLQTKRLRHAEMTEPEIMMEIMIITSEREQGDVQGCKQCAEQENPSVVVELLDAAASGRFHGEWTLGGRVGKEVAAPAVWMETLFAEVRARLQQ